MQTLITSSMLLICRANGRWLRSKMVSSRHRYLQVLCTALKRHPRVE